MFKEAEGASAFRQALFGELYNPIEQDYIYIREVTHMICAKD
jgi:hypothetical protein